MQYKHGITMTKKYIKNIKKSLVIVLLLSTWVNKVTTVGGGGNGTLIANEIGFPSGWLTIYSTEASRNVFSLLFEGNEGVAIGIGPLLVSVVMVDFLIEVIKKIINCVKKSRESK